MSWPTNKSEFGPNRTPALIALDMVNEESIVPLAADPTNGALLVENVGGGGGGGTQYASGTSTPATVTGNALIFDNSGTLEDVSNTHPLPVTSDIHDSAGNSLTSTSGSLNVNVTNSTGSTVSGSLTNNNAAPTNNNLGVLPAEATANAPAYVPGNQVLLSTDLLGNLRTTLPATSILGDVTTSARYNQVECNFSQPSFDAGNMINTVSGGGSATQVNGEGVYSAGTAGTGEATGVTAQELEYRPGSEAYAYFTAAFTTPTDGTNANYQRIGPYISTDGFYVGYEKTTFGITIRQNSTNTFTPQSSFNIDTLTGSAGSHFTRNGVPEALIQTDLNLYRIRWSWFGTAPILYEVLSPDGIWVTFHDIRHPNTSPLPSIFQSNLYVQIDVSKTSSDSTNLTILSSCIAAGMSVSQIKISDPVTNNSLAVLDRSVITGQNPSGGYANVSISPDNALSIAGSGDATVPDVTWTSSTTLNTTYSFVSGVLSYNTVGIQLVGTGSGVTSGRVTFEISVDGTNWGSALTTNINTQSLNSAAVAPIVGVMDLQLNITGFNYCRVRLSTVIGSGGSLVISNVLQSLATPNNTLTLGPSAFLTANQGTPNGAMYDAWPFYITNGSYKANVTSANALVVDGSAATQPVSNAGTFATQVTSLPALPTGSNTIGSVEITDGTNTENVLKSDGTSAGTNALITAAQFNASSTATWTTSTTVNTALAQSTKGQGTATVTTVETGTTTTAGALTFEVYDGTNWWAVEGQQTGSYTIQSSYTLVNGINVAWVFNVAGYQQFRVRLSTAITGTGSPQVVVILQTEALAMGITPSVGVAQQLDSTNDSISAFIKGFTYTKIAASGVVVSGPTLFAGFTVEASTVGTAIFYDNTAASGNTVGGTGTAISLTAGTNVFYTTPFICTTGLYFTLGGTSATINVLTRQISK